MDIDDSSNQLCKYLLHLLQRKSAMIDEVVIQFVTCYILAFYVSASRLIIVPGQYSNTSHTRFSVTMTSYSRAM